MLCLRPSLMKVRAHVAHNFFRLQGNCRHCHSAHPLFRSCLVTSCASTSYLTPGHCSWLSQSVGLSSNIVAIHFKSGSPFLARSFLPTSFTDPCLGASTLELYLLRQWPCQCTNNSLPCAAGSSQTNPPGINETIVNPSTGKVYSMPLLQEGQWYNGSIMNPYDVQYMKFHVPYSSAMPCPIITIDFEMKTGTLSVFAASSYIPTLSTYQWARAFVNPSTIAICPSNPNFVFGSYYLLINNQAGRVSNIYSIRYTLQNSPQCTQIPVDYSTVPILPVPNTTAWSTPVWLEDGIMNSFTLAPLPAPRKAHQWYALYAPERCALFNVGLYKDTYADGQILLLGSATNSTPTVTNSSSVQWSSLFPADNKLDLHYCNPDLSANYSILYIGVYVGTAVGSYKIIGTTQRYTPSVPYSSLAFSQSRLDAEFGALPALSCDNGIYTCSYHAFQGCLATGVACCVTFWPVAPEEHPQTYVIASFHSLLDHFYLYLQLLTLW